MTNEFQELFHEHSEEPVKIPGGLRTYTKQDYDPSWEQIWCVYTIFITSLSLHRIVGGIFGALRCIQVERTPRKTVLVVICVLADPQRVSRYHVFANMRLQDGPESNDVDNGVPTFPDSAKKKQFASARDQKELEKKERQSNTSKDAASSTCKKHNWVPHFEKDVVCFDPFCFIAITFMPFRCFVACAAKEIRLPSHMLTIPFQHFLILPLPDP